MNLLKCTGKDNEETLFQYRFETIPYDEPKEINFTVVPALGEYSDFFNFALSVVDPNYLKINMMTANGQAIYRGKGIPAALMNEVGILFDKIIISSANGKRAGEYRTKSATKVWDRLVANSLAEYNAQEDRYVYTAYRK